MAKKLDILLVIDLESTCWEKSPPKGQSSEIIEIGIATLDLATCKPLEKRSILVKPVTSTVSPFCEELTTITQDMLDEQGISLKEACQILRKEYDCKNRTWASWGDYDRRQFERDCEAKGLRYPFGVTHLNAKSMHALLSGATREEGMARALSALGIELEGTHHRGHDDAWNIAKIIGHILHTSPLRHT
jgi:inhibitor of KinA sporulation pathway (predicted exonuclease)